MTVISRLLRAPKLIGRLGVQLSCGMAMLAGLAANAAPPRSSDSTTPIAAAAFNVVFVDRLFRLVDELDTASVESLPLPPERVAKRQKLYDLIEAEAINMRRNGKLSGFDRLLDPEAAEEDIQSTLGVLRPVVKKRCIRLLLCAR